MKPLPLTVAAMAILAGATFMAWPAGSAAFGPQASSWPSVLARTVAIAIGMASYASALSAGVAAILWLPSRWHIAVKALAFMVVGALLLLAAGLAVVLPMLLLHLVCVVAKACAFWAWLEALNHAYGLVVSNAAYAEAQLVVPLLLGLAVALRRNAARQQGHPAVGNAA